MTLNYSFHASRALSLCVAILVVVVSGYAQKRSPEASATNDYTVELRDPVFHVTTKLNGLKGQYVDVALPIWTPGVYDRKNYAVNVRKFQAFDSKGQPTSFHKIGPSVWRIDTRGQAQVRVEFNYAANDLAWNGVAIKKKFAFFTGTQLFLEQVGHRNKKALVNFVAPEGWKILSALTKTDDPAAFTAGDYDELVDSPTLLGSYESSVVQVDDVPFTIAIAPAGGQCTDDLEEVKRTLPSIVRAERSIFGSLPFSSYTIFCVEGMQGAAVEHGNSVVTSWLHSVNLAHEIFHAWNVKRMRPAELWPYDYQDIKPGPSLWVSEGVTSYYESLINFRAGVNALVNGVDGAGPAVKRFTDPEENFTYHLASEIAELEGDRMRPFVSPADASTSDGLEYGAISPSYYVSGEILGLLLDLSIIHDTNGAHRLDDVMRQLYRDSYLKGRGFTPADMVSTVNSVAGRDYSEFFKKYVNGTDVPPYEEYFGYVGYKISHTKRQLGILPGFRGHSTPEGREVFKLQTSSPAALAGLREGDIIISLDGVPFHQIQLANLGGKFWDGGQFVGRAGERAVLRVKRTGGSKVDIPVVLGSREQTVYRLESVPDATPNQLRFRAAWLKH